MKFNENYIIKSSNQDSSKLFLDQKGQVSIFLAVITTIVITLVAFVINVGLFVKAKINLQNAVDAGAWSGAAAQARRLSGIAYLNWEMRNTYKEWMFKYYVLGQYANTKTGDGSGPNMDFRLKKFDPADASFDQYNIPSICIHFGSSHNICNVYTVPGLPRFEVAGLPNVSEDFKAAIDSFVGQKSKNCMIRSLYNFAAAQNYAFSTGGQDAVEFQDVPSIAGYRTGAWIQAIELALRVRSLESILNRPPIEEDMCAAPGACPKDLASLGGEYGNVPAYNERPRMALHAIIKNLGGGNFKGSTQFLNSLRVNEIAPTKFVPGATSLDQLFIPTNPTGGTPGDAREKFYVNLRPMLFNFVTFFNTFVARDQSLSDLGIAGGENINSEGACRISRTALPVPGYVMGFYKDPRIMTYYALKARATYKGLLNPFTPAEGIELQAYAAAKPYGGRIGPILVEPVNWNQFDKNTPRSDNMITSQYALGYDTNTPGPYEPGLPIPMNTSSSKFYIHNSAPSSNPILGGRPSAGANDTKFAIPNMIYTMHGAGNLRAGTGLFDVSTKYSDVSRGQLADTAGLFNTEQFFKLREALTGASGFVSGAASINSQATILDAIKRARGVTNYDIKNYLVPTHEDFEVPGSRLESPPTLKKMAGRDDDLVAYYAPIMKQNTIYPNSTTVQSVMTDYLTSLEGPVQRYLDALKDVADSMIAAGGGGGGPNNYELAAKAIYDSANPPQPNPAIIAADETACKAAPLADKFNYLFRSDSPNRSCGILALRQTVNTYVEKIAAEGKQDFYLTTYRNELTSQGSEAQGLTNVEISTAYAPGALQGSDVNGTVLSPFPNTQPSDLVFARNYYSTKFVSLNALFGSHQDFKRFMYRDNYPGSYFNNPDKEFMNTIDRATNFSEFTNGAAFPIDGITSGGEGDGINF